MISRDVCGDAFALCYLLLHRLRLDATDMIATIAGSEGSNERVRKQNADIDSSRFEILRLLLSMCPHFEVLVLRSSCF